MAGFYGSILPAAWSFQLALRSRGLGTSWTTLHLVHESEVATLLGIPADVTQVALFRVAYTIGTEFRPAARRPIEELTYWNTWGDVDAGPVSLEELIDRAAGLALEQAAENEQARALSGELVDALRATGLLRAGAPRQLGALEAAPAVTLAGAERIARGDAATGWCVAIAATASLLAGYLPAEGAAEVLGHPTDIAAGVWAPNGTATPDGNGVRISGRWPFCSGIAHSNWLIGGCVLGAGDAGPPKLRLAALPVAELEILDTWHRADCAATGSHDAVAAELFVPGHRFCSIVDAPPRVDAPLYRFPLLGYFALSIAAAALGNARGAVDDLIDLAAGKVGQGSKRTLAEHPATQAAVGAVRGGAARRAAALLRRDRGGVGRGSGRPGRRHAAARAAPGRDPRRAHLRGRRARDVRPRRRQRGLRELAAAAALPRRPHRDRAFPGQPGDLGARPAGCCWACRPTPTGCDARHQGPYSRIRTDRHVTQPSSFSNSVIATATTSKPRARIRSAVRGASADISTAPSPRSTTALPCSSGTARKSGKAPGSALSLRPMIVSSGRALTRTSGAGPSSRAR